MVRQQLKSVLYMRELENAEMEINEFCEVLCIKLNEYLLQRNDSTKGGGDKSKTTYSNGAKAKEKEKNRVGVGSVEKLKKKKGDMQNLYNTLDHTEKELNGKYASVCYKQVNLFFSVSSVVQLKQQTCGEKNKSIVAFMLAKSCNWSASTYDGIQGTLHLFGGVRMFFHADAMLWSTVFFYKTEVNSKSKPVVWSSFEEFIVIKTFFLKSSKKKLCVRSSVKSILKKIIKIRIIKNSGKDI
ncbi:hypothetical protein RFI_23004 [Reticulomyxa filosa]|uniref:Uncharacterized protein n=1 Tax=Reticulomyxa filosa TaxID=46433 RepID=X6MMS7_RETFI|nr:hypothetical protein RFI_23004 [Reticulomyxa filosa]|eukprot:ETO14365.1 hypothetical protein RFI_23004 [Reticulomyxa filosa]